MSRYIDADALDKRIYNDIPISVFGSIKKMAAVREIIAEQPTVDAVPVVRCKDCTFHNEINCPQYYRRNELPDDWFCAGGE